MTSQINPADINGEYPVAGVSNNTQGMRDNFTNIKQNFQYAENEIDDLQSKVLLKAALTGTTLDNNMADNLIYAAKIQDFSATSVLLAATSGSIAIDYSAGHYQTIAMSGNVSLSFTNFPAAGSAGMLRLQIIVDAAGRTLTLPVAVSLGTTGIQGYSANVITFANAGTFEFGFVTTDAGATITLFDLNRPLSYFTNSVTISNTLSSTSTTTGALTVGGGVGINGNLYVGGNIVGNLVVANQSFTGNVTGGNILTGGIVSATGNITGGNIRTAGQVSSAGNVTGSYIIGDGSQLTNIVASSGAAITNGSSNVRVSANSNVAVNVTGTANVVQWATSGEYVTGVISATGNIVGGNISTNGALGAASIGVGGAVSATGNITGGNLNAVGLSLSSNVVSALNVTSNVAGGNLRTSGQISAAGNIVGNYLFGNGSQITGLTSGSKIVSGTTELLIDIPSGNIQGSVGGTANVVVFTPTGADIIGSMTTSGSATISGNIAGGNILTAGLVSATGNLIGTNINATGNISLTANVIAGNLTTSNQVVATGNITGGNIRTDGQVLALNATAIPAGGAAGQGYLFSTATNFGVFFGSGAPTLAAAKGSLYLRSDGTTTNDRMYVNTNGTTAWTAVITAA